MMRRVHTLCISLEREKCPFFLLQRKPGEWGFFQGQEITTACSIESGCQVASQANTVCKALARQCNLLCGTFFLSLLLCTIFVSFFSPPSITFLMVRLKLFSLERYTVGVFAVPFRVLSRQKYDRRYLTIN